MGSVCVIFLEVLSHSSVLLERNLLSKKQKQKTKLHLFLFVITSQLKMTTAVPLTNNTQLSVNVTTKSQEQSLYQSSGAIVAAIVVGVIIIFTVVLLILKTYNRRMRVRRELEPKASKLAVPPPLGHNSHSLAQQPTVTFIPVDIHMHSR